MIIDSRYEVLERLGTGLWATVYKVRDLRTDAEYALKLFHKLDSAGFYEKFSAEDMHHITRIEHPNLLRILTFGNMGEHIYYLSEFYDGRTLGSFRFKKYNIELLYDIIVQICYALNALHIQNIIHKDLKPQNIMYKITRTQPEVKVLDFGFAKMDVEKSQQTIGGSLPYIAPEIYLGKGAVPQSDYYSLGVTLYRILTDVHPFSIEQISGLIAGSHQNFFPRFLREFNPDIPAKLEKFVLKLLEKNPEDRYQDIESIISYINRIQLKKYPFSQKRSAVTMIRFRSYFARSDYAHRLLDYIPIVEDCNGKLVVVIGGEGLGKNNLFSLFRYHLLTDQFFVFDYECSAENKDPFFALIKEFYSYVTSNEKLNDDLKNISEKFHKYLFDSEEHATGMHEDEEELSLDFNSARDFLFHLSEVKTLIFILRAGQFLTEETIRFVNFISKGIMERRILIVIGVDDPSKVKGLIHTIQIKINPFTPEQTKEYITKLTHVNVGSEFAGQVWERSSGNPMFIRDILTDLTERRLIWKKGSFNLNYDFEKYKLPEHLQHSVYNRMSHLSPSTYIHLQSLANVFTPLSKNLICFVLQIDDKEVFLLINEGVNNELLVKRGEYYYFCYRETKERLIRECPEDITQKTASRVIEYFRDKEITDGDICRGVIRDAYLISDYSAVREYLLVLGAIYSSEYRQEETFEEICKVIELDFSGQIEVSETQLKQDLAIFCDKAELTGFIQHALDLVTKIENFPDIFEKYYIIGTFLLAQERHQKAAEYFEEALHHSITGKQRIMVSINIIWNSYRLGDLDKAREYIQLLEDQKMSPALEVAFIDRKSLCLDRQGETTAAINLIENFLVNLKQKNDTSFLARLGSLYNNLGYYHTNQRDFEEAHRNFTRAMELWEKINYNRKLGLVYNNIGDLALRQGDTTTAFEYFQRAYDICKKVEQRRGQALAFLNFAEANIKLGQFADAEDYLSRSGEIIQEMDNQEQMPSIINNTALARSKIQGFHHYWEFIAEYQPDLIEGKIERITPLVKTWFYYLHGIGNIEKIRRLLQTNTHLDFNASHSQEFYHQILGLICLQDRDYAGALHQFNQAYEYAERDKSAYALAILSLREAQCCIGFSDIRKAREALSRARKQISNYNFRYWEIELNMIQCDVDLLDEDIPIRTILRKLITSLEYVYTNELYQLEIQLYERIIQVYAHLRAETEGREYFKKYKRRVHEVVQGLPEEDQQHFLDKCMVRLENFRELRSIRIAPRYKYQRDEWQEQLYDLFKLNEIDRMKFFIDKTIQNLLAPHCYSIVLYEELKSQKSTFMAYNCSPKNIFTPEYFYFIEKSIEGNKIIQKEFNGKHRLFIPLKIRNTRVGCFLLADDGELEYRGIEMSIIKALRLHLTSILMRIKEFAEVNHKMNLMHRLMNLTRDLFSMYDLGKLEQEIISFAIDFTGCSRGFFIKKDKAGNYLYAVSMDESKHLLNDYTHISRTVLIQVTETMHPVYTINAMIDNTFKSSISVQDYKLHSIYCAPIIIDSQMYGLLYLDNYNSNQDELIIDTDFMDMLLIQISVAIKNALQYDSLMKKNQELQTLDSLKENFIAIVSHELNHPLVTLKGYVDRMRKHISPEFEDTSRDLDKVESSVKKLLSTTNQILDLYKYSSLSRMSLERQDIGLILESLANEARSISESRHMNIVLEIQESLPDAPINEEAFRLMLYNIVLNAIRFTKDFGKIVIGARKAVFQKEKSDDAESVIIYVQDNGIGIPEAQQKYVFNKFYEINDLWSHKSGFVDYKSSGLGLGLATAKRIVELHQGRIWLQSKENEGTTVFISIPVETGMLKKPVPEKSEENGEENDQDR